MKKNFLLFAFMLGLISVVSAQQSGKLLEKHQRFNSEQKSSPQPTLADKMAMLKKYEEEKNNKNPAAADTEPVSAPQIKRKKN